MAENITSAKATAKMVRVSSRKVRLVLDTIRNKSVAEAFAILLCSSSDMLSDMSYNRTLSLKIHFHIRHLPQLHPGN